jgi:integrase
VTPCQARVEAQRVLAERAAGRDPQAEKREAKRRLHSNQVTNLVAEFISRHVSQNRTARETIRILHREVLPVWGTWTIHEVRKRDVIAFSKNGKPHIVHLSDQAICVLRDIPRSGALVFSSDGKRMFQGFSKAKGRLDHASGVSGWTLHDLRRTVVSGMARLGIAPHVADKILNHQSGTISGVAAVYQRHEFLNEREAALCRWGQHVENLTASAVHLPSTPELGRAA